MTRVNFWIAPTLAVALAAIGAPQRAAAQTNSGASTEVKTEAKTEAKQDAKQSDQSSASEAQTSGQSTSSGNQASGSASNQTSASGSTSQGAGQGSTSAQGQSQSGQQPQAGQSSNRSNQSGQNTQGQTNTSAQQNRNNQTPGAQQRDNQSRDNQNRDNQRNNTNVNIGVGIQFGAVNDRGITVTTVERNSLFYTSGIRQGDVIVSVSGRPIRNHDEFVQFISLRRGDRIPVIVIREGKQETIHVVYEEGPANLQVNAGNQPGAALLGVTFDSQTQNAAVIVSVTPNGPAAQIGLKPGDHIVSINGRRLNGFQNAIQVVGAMQPGDQVEIEYLQLQRGQLVLSAPGNVQTTAAVGVNQNVQTANYPPSGQVQGGQAQTNTGSNANTNNRPQQSDRQNQPNNQDRSLLPRIRN